MHIVQNCLEMLAIRNRWSGEDAFMAFAKERGMVGIKGHRSVGGFRASLYNACPVEAVEALVQCMQDFEKANK